MSQSLSLSGSSRLGAPWWVASASAAAATTAAMVPQQLVLLPLVLWSFSLVVALGFPLVASRWRVLVLVFGFWPGLKC